MHKRFIIISLQSLPSTRRTGNHSFGLTSTMYESVVWNSWPLVGLESLYAPTFNCKTSHLKILRTYSLCGLLYLALAPNSISNTTKLLEVFSSRSYIQLLLTTVYLHNNVMMHLTVSHRQKSIIDVSLGNDFNQNIPLQWGNLQKFVP